MVRLGDYDNDLEKSDYTRFHYGKYELVHDPRNKKVTAEEENSIIKEHKEAIKALDEKEKHALRPKDVIKISKERVRILNSLIHFLEVQVGS